MALMLTRVGEYFYFQRKFEEASYIRPTNGIAGDIGYKKTENRIRELRFDGKMALQVLRRVEKVTRNRSGSSYKE